MADLAGKVVQVDDLRFSVPLDAVRDGLNDVAVDGARVTLGCEGFQALVSHLVQQTSALSQERIDGLLAAMDENPRLRPIRWSYASLFRVAGLRDALDICGDLIDGGIELRARFAQAESGNLLRQLRDRARNLATVTARLHLAAVDGALHLRLDLSPDVNGLLTNHLLNRLGERPGLSRVDGTTVRIDLAEAVASATADRRPRPRLVGRLLDVRITLEQAVFVLG